MRDGCYRLVHYEVVIFTGYTWTEVTKAISANVGFLQFKHEMPFVVLSVLLIFSTRLLGTDQV